MKFVLLKFARWAVLSLTLVLAGCVNTGVNIGGVFIPVNTGLGETNKPDREEEPEAPAPKSAPQDNEDGDSSTEQESDNPPK